MPAPRQYLQMVELPDELVGNTLLVDQSLSFGSAYLSLDAVLVQTAEQSFQVGAEVQNVMRKSGLPAQSRALIEIHRSRTSTAQFEVLARLGGEGLLNMGKEIIQFNATADQRIAVVGKWQRYQARSGQKALARQNT